MSRQGILGERRGGRKRIVAPDGSELAPASEPQRDGTLVKALARAHVCRVLRLTLLAPDIVERIPRRGCPAPHLAELMQPFPAAWEKQRERFQQ